MSGLDLSIPGPAGLFFDPSLLTDEAAAQDRAVRAALAPRCSICGSLRAPYGYGDFSDGRPGARFACGDIICRAQAKAQVCLKPETGRAA